MITHQLHCFTITIILMRPQELRRQAKNINREAKVKPFAPSAVCIYNVAILETGFSGAFFKNLGLFSYQLVIIRKIFDYDCDYDPNRLHEFRLKGT